MNIVLQRQPSARGATLGRITVDGKTACFSCEDVIRERPGVPVAAWKVHGATAIPAGVYRVIVTESNRFKRRLPLLVAVPGFEGIRIHPGNTAEDTEGCILPGNLMGADRVGDSRKAFDALFAQIEAAIARGETVTIHVKNPDTF